MRFSLKRFINDIPQPVLKEYFTHYPVTFRNTSLWQDEGKSFVKKLVSAIEHFSKEDYEQTFINFERIGALANEKGMKALLDASTDTKGWETKFRFLGSDAHRAMTVFLESPTHFRTAEELLYVDYQAEGRSWKSFSIGRLVTLGEKLIKDNTQYLAEEIAAIFYSNAIDSNDCCAEVYRRASDNSIQISIYVNDLPDTAVQVKNRELSTIKLKRVIIAALVYHPKTGTIDTITGGGKEKHEKILQAFMHTMFNYEAPFTPVQPSRFLIEKFRTRPEPPMLCTSPTDGIEKIRIRRIDVYAAIPHQCFITVDTLAHQKHADIYENPAFFDETGALYSYYDIVAIKLTLHFKPTTEHKKGRNIHVCLHKTSSDIKNLCTKDRLLVESYLREWELIEEEEQCHKTGTNG